MATFPFFSHFDQQILHRAEKGLLALIVITLFVGLFGYSFFTLNPQNLARFSSVAGLHGVAMVVMSQVQSLLFVFVMFIKMLQHFSAVFVFSCLFLSSGIGFLAEYMGTTTGLPFGQYAYTEMMGAKILGHVPWVIPLSWFAVGYPCYVIASHYFGCSSRYLLVRSLNVLALAAMGGWLLMTWDFVLDPAMSHLLPYWEWHQEGFFYNSPLINFFGWFVTGAVIMLVFEFLFRKLRFLRESNGDLDQSQVRLGAHKGHALKWSLLFFLLNFVMPAGMCMLAGAWKAPLVSVASLFLAFFCANLLRNQLSKLELSLGQKTLGNTQKIEPQKNQKYQEQ